MSDLAKTNGELNKQPKKSPLLEALNEPAAKFPVADFLIFFPNLIREKLEEQGFDKTWNLSTEEMIFLGIIAAQYVISAGARGAFIALENRGITALKTPFGTVEVKDLEGVPLIGVGAGHLPLAFMMASSGQKELAATALMWALGDMWLGAPNSIPKKLNEKLSLTQGQSGHTYKTLARSFGPKVGSTINDVRRFCALAIMNPNTYFAAGNFLVGLSMVNNVDNGSLAQQFSTAAFAVPLCLAAVQTIKNQYVQMRDNLAFPPSDGEPLRLFGLSVMFYAMVNAGFEATDALEITDVLGDRSDVEQLCNRITTTAQFIIAAAYFQFSQRFEGLKINLPWKNRKSKGDISHNMP